MVADIQNTRRKIHARTRAMLSYRQELFFLLGAERLEAVELFFGGTFGIFFGLLQEHDLALEAFHL